MNEVVNAYVKHPVEIPIRDWISDQVHHSLRIEFDPDGSFGHNLRALLERLDVT